MISLIGSRRNVILKVLICGLLTETQWILMKTQVGILESGLQWKDKVKKQFDAKGEQ